MQLVLEARVMVSRTMSAMPWSCRHLREFGQREAHEASRTRARTRLAGTNDKSGAQWSAKRLGDMIVPGSKTKAGAREFVLVVANKGCCWDDDSDVPDAAANGVGEFAEYELSCRCLGRRR